MRQFSSSSSPCCMRGSNPPASTSASRLYIPHGTVSVSTSRSGAAYTLPPTPKREAAGERERRCEAGVVRRQRTPADARHVGAAVG